MNFARLTTTVILASILVVSVLFVGAAVAMRLKRARRPFRAPTLPPDSREDSWFFVRYDPDPPTKGIDES